MPRAGLPRRPGRGPHQRRRDARVRHLHRPVRRSGHRGPLLAGAPLAATGRAAGLTYGALLLVVAGTRLDPLRPGNPDFDLVGPGWVSVAAFATLVVFHGVLVAALAGSR